MALPCNTSLSGFENSLIKTEITLSGQIKTVLKVKPYYPAGYVGSTGTNLNPSQLTTNDLKGITTSTPASLDPNVFLQTGQGYAVLAGATDTLLLFKDAVTSEIKGDVLVAPAPNPANPSDPSQPMRNALTKNSDGLAVYTNGLPSNVDPSACAGAYTYFDNDSGELRVWIESAPEIIGDDCAPLIDAKGNRVKKNAFHCTPAGYAVLTGQGENVIETYVDCSSLELRARLIISPDDGCSTDARKGTNGLVALDTGAAVLLGLNAKGGIETFRDCTSNKTLGRIVLHPEDQVADCNPKTRKNAATLLETGLLVAVGSTKSLNTFVDCESNEIRVEHIIESQTAKVLSVTDSGLTMHLSAKDASGAASPGLVISSDGLAAYGPNCDLYAHDGESAERIFNADGGTTAHRTLKKSVTNSTGKKMSGFVLFRLPKVISSLSPGLEVKVSYSGGVTVGNATQGIGELYFNPNNNGVYQAGHVMSACTSGQMEFRQVTIDPGGTVTAELTPSVQWNASGNGSAVLGSYSVDIYLQNVDCVGPAS